MADIFGVLQSHTFKEGVRKAVVFLPAILLTFFFLLFQLNFFLLSSDAQPHK